MKTPVMVETVLMFDMAHYNHMNELLDSINEGTSFVKEGVVDVNSPKMLLWVKPRITDNSSQVTIPFPPKVDKNAN